MIPSILVMKIGSLDNYNNNILIATDDMNFGVNNINNKQIDMGSNLSPSGVTPTSTPTPTSSPPTSTPPPPISSHPTSRNPSWSNDAQYVLPVVIGLGVGLIVYFMK